jgi:hypothetical protein
MTQQTTDDARAAHRQSVREFIAIAESIDDDAWERPLAEGKWSPAQITEHLRLAYEVVLQEQAGGMGIRVRSKWWIRPLLRYQFLPMILRGGVLPAGARAPREIRPGPGPFERAPLIDALRTLTERAEAVLVAARPNAQGFTHHVFTHHVFGRLSATQSLRFVTVHNQHHTRQLKEVAAIR